MAGTGSKNAPLRIALANNSASTPIVVSRDTPQAVNVRMAGISAQIIAERIIAFGYEHGDQITNLRLQKLLYYAQAWHLAMHGKPLFKDRFEAWANGPIQPDVYGHFRRFGGSAIEHPVRTWKLPKKVEAHIKDLFVAYGRLSAFELELLSRQELPWAEARRGTAPDEPSVAVISIDTMKKFYKSQFDEQVKSSR